MSRSQKIGQKHSIKIANRSFEGGAKFRYVGTTLTDQNCMHEEIKSRLNLIVPVVLYGCETWSRTLRVILRHGLQVNE
jgi:hypothetical protein